MISFKGFRASAFVSCSPFPGPFPCSLLSGCSIPSSLYPKTRLGLRLENVLSPGLVSCLVAIDRFCLSFDPDNLPFFFSILHFRRILAPEIGFQARLGPLPYKVSHLHARRFRDFGRNVNVYLFITFQASGFPFRSRVDERR